MNPVVTLEQASKHYGDLIALENINLELQEGEIMGLLGHNGAGKTTTMKLILGVIELSSGNISLLGKSPTGPNSGKLRRSIGYLPENVSFYNQLTGREVLNFFGKLKGVDRNNISGLLDKVGLSHAADRRVKTYSKGMRQRLGLAQALLGHPKLLLLDEPTAGLDPAATNDFYETLDELRKQGTTILISSHVLPGVEKHIDRAAILGNGRLLALGNLEELNHHAQLPLTIRVHGHWPNTDWPNPDSKRRFDELDVSFRQVNGTRVELTTRIQSKLEVMRILLAEPDIQDIDVIHPTLDNLYAHYCSQEHAQKESLS